MPAGCYSPDFGNITVVTARTVIDLVFVDELAQWAQHLRVQAIQCVDRGGQTPEWSG